MQSEIDKLNPSQKRTLRRLFSGRTATELHVDANTSQVTVAFGPSCHSLMLGPRGGIVYHEIQQTWAAAEAAHTTA